MANFGFFGLNPLPFRVVVFAMECACLALVASVGARLTGRRAAGFLAACVGALFVTEQYYPPLWFLPAIAASLATSLPGPGPDDLGMTAGHLHGATAVPAIHR